VGELALEKRGGGAKYPTANSQNGYALGSSYESVAVSFNISASCTRFYIVADCMAGDSTADNYSKSVWYVDVSSGYTELFSRNNANVDKPGITIGASQISVSCYAKPVHKLSVTLIPLDA